MMKMREICTGGVAALVLFALWLVVQPRVSLAAEANEIDLEIFNLEELEGAPDLKISGGCSMSFWQHNKVPFKDKYYYVFYRDIGAEGKEPAGYIQINGKFVPVMPFAEGGVDHGFGLRDRQVYRGKENTLWVIIDIKAGKPEGEVVPAQSGSMRVVENGKKQFLVKIKGEAGC